MMKDRKGPAVDNDKPSNRSFIGMFVMIVGLTLYAFAAAALGDYLIDWPVAVQVIYYLIAGILWIFPAKRLLYWMGNKEMD